MNDSKNNPIGLVFGVALLGVVLGALSTRLMLSERTEGPLFALYERVDGVIVLLWLIIGLILLAGGVTYATF